MKEFINNAKPDDWVKHFHGLFFRNTDYGIC
jgi:hypothetical protein